MFQHLTKSAGLAVVSLATLCLSLGRSENTPASTNALARLKAAWPTVESRVVGSPDPALPYRVVRMHPNLRLSNLLVAENEPGSKRLLLIDQDGSYKLRRTTDEPEKAEVETLIDFDQDVAYSVAFHPSFAENGYLYVGGKRVGSGDDAHKICHVTRYTIQRGAPFRLDLNSAQTIIEWESDGHDGAAIAFGLDGMMYVTTGDGTSDSDTNLKGQGLDHLLSKVLRIDVDEPIADRAYAVPPNNPFVDMPGVRPETWAYGFRNPWRMSIDPRTGAVWVGNNGQDLWEQVYLVRRGANYGWSVYEGSHIFYANRELGPTPVSPPTFEHPHSEARSLTGGVVYYGRKLPELYGAYLYGDYSTGKIWAAKVEGQRVLWHKEIADSTLAISWFGFDGDGELLIADYRGNREGGLYTLEPNEVPDTTDAFPRKLSETGLFASVSGHDVAEGLIPYTVNAPLWSDGAYKERYLFLPVATREEAAAQKPPISMSDRGWNFPDRTVLVKSFALGEDADESTTRRWIETRLLTKQQGEWIGYSYRWNEEQTEATLVAKEGADAIVESPSGASGPMKWRFPSRTECMVCHSRAANFVLGLTTLQMNKLRDYGDLVANQLEALDYLGALRVDWTEEVKDKLRRSLQASGLDDERLSERVRDMTSGGARAEPGLLSNHWTDAFPRLVNPYDPREDLGARARSYLHANCAQCHVGAGGGNSQIDLEFTRPLRSMKLVNEKPLHDKFDLPDARLVAPGAPERSVLLHRVSTRGAGQMPQLATYEVDEQARQMLEQWIREMHVP